MAELNADEQFVRQAIALASQARQDGNHPFGVLLLLDGRAVLYTSCEPCAMCVGKIYWAGIRSVVYALWAQELAVLAGSDFLVPCRDLFLRATEAVTVIGPMLVDEARTVHVGFWTKPAA